MKWKETSRGIEFAVKVIPKSSRNAIVGWENDELKIRIAAVPDQGKANDELIRFLAKECNVRISQVAILSGHTSRHKRLCIEDPKVKALLESW